MKARILALLAMVLGVVSCQTEPEGLDVNVGGDSVTTISVVLPEDAISRATAADETNSAWSGLQNTKGETLRVILQVFDENGNTNANATLRQEQVLQEGVLTAYFDVRLVPNRKYTFVAWADQGADYFDATDLKDVKIVEGSWTAMNEYRDAFTATHTEASFTSASNITLNLTRPFAKLRVVTTDMEQLGHLDINPVKAAVSYNVELPNAFNAFAGTIGTTTETKSFTTFDIAEYNKDAAGTKTLFTDYVFVPADGVVKFSLDTKEADGRRIKLNQFTTDIPVKRNNLTTIAGNILTEGSNVTVTVDPVFENAGSSNPNYEYATISSEAEFFAAVNSTTGGQYILISDIDVDGVYASTNAATRTSTNKTVNINLNGKTITVNNDSTAALISLADGAALIFSGEGDIIGSGKLAEEGANVVVTDAVAVDSGVTGVKTGLEALVYICENGGEFTFANNLEAEEIVVVKTTNPVVIDGNGKTLTYKGSGASARAIDAPAEYTTNVAISNLNIVCTADYCQRGINFNNAGTLTLNNVKVSGKNVTYALNLPGSSDNCKIEINNCELTANIALNVWGENAVINANNTIFTSVDNSTVEGYDAVKLNNDGNTSAENSVINIVGGKVIAYDENGKQSTATENNTINGQINISDSTEVVGEQIEAVAIVDYGTDQFYSFTTVDDAIAKVQADKNGTVVLIKDLVLTEKINVKASDHMVVLDLNGHNMHMVDTTEAGFEMINNVGKLTIQGEGKLSVEATINSGWNRRSSVISNTVGGNLTVKNGVVIEHLGGTDMAYGIDNLTNGKGTYAVTTIEGATVKSTDSAISQFLNGVEATNELYVKAGSTLVSPNRSIFFQDPSKNANTGKLVVEAGASVTGDVRLSVTEGSTEWPVKVSVAASALVNGSKVTYGYIPAGYAVVEEKGVWGVKKYEAVADADGLFKNGVEYLVTNANGLATLNAMMANKTAGQYVKVVLGNDIDFTGKTWTPVDSHADSAFWLTEIDGQGHTISNLTINGQAMFTRFAGTGNVTIKDITFDTATVNGSGINTSILTGHTYQNVLLDNVDVKKSSITGGYKVAPLIGTVYNESASTITATLKNCDVENVTVKAISYDFCTTGMVAFVYADDNDTIEFENCSVKNVKLYAPNVYTAHAAIYTEGSETLYNEADGVVVENVTFENI